MFKLSCELFVMGVLEWSYLSIVMLSFMVFESNTMPLLHLGFQRKVLTQLVEIRPQKNWTNGGTRHCGVVYLGHCGGVPIPGKAVGKWGYPGSNGKKKKKNPHTFQNNISSHH